MLKLELELQAKLKNGSQPNINSKTSFLWNEDDEDSYVSSRVENVDPRIQLVGNILPGERHQVPTKR